MRYTVTIIKNYIENFYGIDPSDFTIERFEDVTCIVVDINKAVQSALSPKEHKVINAVKINGYKSAHEILGVSKSTVRNHSFSAYDKIVQYLNGSAANEEILH